MYYNFTIVYPKDGVLETHTEKRYFSMMDQAYDWFQRLCEKYDTGPYYYLCSWR